VNSIYLVPDNNDVKYNPDSGTEEPRDRELYKAFVAGLSDQMPARIRDLSGEATAAW
jgi:hypothetical protein